MQSIVQVDLLSKLIQLVTVLNESKINIINDHICNGLIYVNMCIVRRSESLNIINAQNVPNDKYCPLFTILHSLRTLTSKTSLLNIFTGSQQLLEFAFYTEAL